MSYDLFVNSRFMSYNGWVESSVVVLAHSIICLVVAFIRGKLGVPVVALPRMSRVTIDSVPCPVVAFTRNLRTPVVAYPRMSRVIVQRNDRGSHIVVLEHAPLFEWTIIVTTWPVGCCKQQSRLRGDALRLWERPNVVSLFKAC